MSVFCAFLRGININGKNKIEMSKLKNMFEELGFSEVKTYLNSGNVRFTSDLEDKTEISKIIEEEIAVIFGVQIPVFTISLLELKEIIDNSPEWWGTGDKKIYDNLIFLLNPLKYNDFYDVIGEPNYKYEKIQRFENSVFWSFSRKDYRKTNWWSKTASSSVSKNITIRTANTVRKMIE